LAVIGFALGYVAILSARSDMLWRRVTKILHTIGSCGFVGAAAAAIVLISLREHPDLAALADTRLGIALISQYILLPSLAVVIVSGLLAMALHKPYLNKGWAWAKAASGILVFKGGLHVVGAQTDHAETLQALVDAGETRAVEAVTLALPHEWGLLWAMLFLAAANIVLGVWRPRFGSSRAPVKRDATKPVGARSS
jgi:hypothetical protein